MIELIFVIVILGILAAVAIPRLAATRDDARAAGVKTYIGTVIQAVPAWFAGQQEIRIFNDMQLDTVLWEQAPGLAEYTYTDSNGGTATIKIVALTQAESIDPTAITIALGKPNGEAEDAADRTVAIGNNVPWLVVDLTPAASGIVYTLEHDLGVNDAAIAIAGRRVNWAQ
jgi:general secretion pathway protein G